MKNKVIYVLGNEIEPLDNSPIKLLPQLKKVFPTVTFERLDPTEELPDNTTEEIIFIDSVLGIPKVEIIHYLNLSRPWRDHLSLSPLVTVHDYDLPLSLGLARKLGKIKKVTIIGIPPKSNKEIVLKDVTEAVNKLLFNVSPT